MTKFLVLKCLDGRKYSWSRLEVKVFFTSLMHISQTMDHSYRSAKVMSLMSVFAVANLTLCIIWQKFVSRQ